MSNETKRDVFTRVNKFARELRVYDPERMESKNEIDRDYQEYMSAYDAALPDDLPVIPKGVSEWLTWCKRSNHSLKDALDGETRVSEDTFSRAWVLGAWRIQETGEIVKLEAEKWH